MIVDSTRMKIGDLSKAVGITVRTLHHYHRIGLLVPSHHSDGGHRSYDPDDIRRLYSIISLKELGISLQDIKDIIDRGDVDPSVLIDIRIERTKKELEMLQGFYGQLMEVKQALEGEGPASLTDLLRIMDMLRTNPKRYMTEEQVQRLKTYYMSFSPLEMEAMRTKWSSMIDILKCCKSEDKPADCSEMGIAVSHWLEFRKGMQGENRDILDAAHRYHSENPGNPMGFGLTPDLYAYLMEGVRLCSKCE